MLICTGLFMMWYFGIHTVKIKELPDKNTSDDDLREYAEMQEDMNTRRSNALRIPMTVLGGILILASIPLFYAPYDDKGLKLRWKIKRHEKSGDDDENLKDPEFDYPDDDFDFIIRRETYELLHKEQLENIRKKRNRNK
jgi:hypothetical protein